MPKQSNDDKHEKHLCIQCNLFAVNPKIGQYCNNCFLDLDIISNTRLRKGSINTDADGSFCDLKIEIQKRFIQKNKKRCWQCDKKIGFMDYRCRCKYYFCKRHRLAEKHDCKYDYFSEGQRELIKQNPSIKKRKIQKI